MPVRGTRARSFADTVKQARVELGMTQQRVAERVGVSRMSVSNWERGLQVPYVPQLKKLARVLKLDHDALVAAWRKAESARHREQVQRATKRAPVSEVVAKARQTRAATPQTAAQARELRENAVKTRTEAAELRKRVRADREKADSTTKKRRP